MDLNRSEQARSIPLAKRVSRSFNMEDVGSLWLLLADNFDGDTKDLCELFHA